MRDQKRDSGRSGEDDRVYKLAYNPGDFTERIHAELNFTINHAIKLLWR